MLCSVAIYQQVHKPSMKQSGATQGEEEDGRASESEGLRASWNQEAPPPKMESPPTTGGVEAQIPGKRLSKNESVRALKKAPVDSTGKQRLCWDFSGHRGCPFSAQTCACSRQQITNVSMLDWTAQAELIRRGGLRNGKKPQPTQSMHALISCGAKREWKPARSVPRLGVLAS